MMRSDLLIRRSRVVDMVMYHPLDEARTILPTGQTASTVGSVSYLTQAGRNCAYFPAGAYIKTTTPPFFDWTDGFTFCVWAYFMSSGNTRTFISAGNSGGALSMSKNANGQFNTFGNTFSGNVITASAWHHVAASLGTDNKTVKVYLDGSIVDTYTRAAAPGIGDIDEMAIGGNVPGYTYNTRAVYMADARIYKRVLTAAELTIIKNGGRIQ